MWTNTVQNAIIKLDKEERTMAVSVKEKRIEFRVPEEAKLTLEEAARLANVSLSSYILTVCLKQAKLDLEQNETIILQDKDRDTLMKALSEPIAPNEALKNLFK